MEKLRRSSLSSASRAVLRATSMLLVAGSATGCVAAKHYEEARSVAETEARGHARTRERLEASLARIRALEVQLADEQRRLSEGANAAEESKLASTVAVKEREAAVELVEQLRTQLARTGDHLLIFAKEKRDLAQTLLLAEQRTADIENAGKRLGELVAATRDLSLELTEALGNASVELAARDGQVVLTIPGEQLFSSSDDALATSAAPLLAAVGKVSGKHPTLRVVLRDQALTPSSARLLRLGDALRQRGVDGARLVLPAATVEQPANGDATALPTPNATEGDGSVSAPDHGDVSPLKPATAAHPAAAPAGSTPKVEIAFAP